MMKIEMMTLMAGPERVLTPGQVVDLPTREAKGLIKAGAAKKHAASASEKPKKASPTPKKDKETATANPKENASLDKAAPPDGNEGGGGAG